MALRILMLVCTLLSVSEAAEQWQPLGGPLGGDVRCMAVDASEPSRVYLGLGSHSAGEYAAGGGLFYSDDSGAEWHRGGLQNVKVSGITTISGRIWAATYGHGVFAGTDPEGEWSQENTALPDLDALCIAGFGTRLVVGTQTGPFYADAATAHWFATDMSMPREVWSIASAPWLPQLMLAATDSGVWRSETGGRMWSFSGTGMDSMDLRSVAIGMDGRCWAGSRGEDNGAMVYVSADTGHTWSGCVAFPAYRAEAVWAILPRAGEVLVGTGTYNSGKGYIYRLQDGASAWAELVNGHYRHVRVLMDLPQGGDRILAGFESCGGVIGSTDGGASWSPLLAGLDAGNVFTMELLDPPSGLLGFGLGFSGAYTVSEDWGASWTRMDSLFPSVFVRGIVVHPSNPQLVYAAAWNGIYRTTTAGAAWEEVPAALSLSTGIDLSLADPAIVYAAGTQGLSVSFDGGDTWGDPDSTFGLSVEALAVDPRDAMHAYVAASWSSVFETHDAGVSWDTLAIQSCRTLAFHPTDAQWIYAGAQGGVYVSADGGETFQFLTAGLPGLWVNAVIADPQDPAVIWAGTPGGVYKSINGGQAWHVNSDGMANLDVRAFEFHDESRRIFVGSHSGGVHWAFADATPTDGSPSGSAWISSLRLQVAPVPCVDEVRVSLLGEVRPGDGVRVALYSLDGKRINTGGYRLPDSGLLRLGHLPAGSYVLRVESASAKASQAITLVR